MNINDIEKRYINLGEIIDNFLNKKNLEYIQKNVGDGTIDFSKEYLESNPDIKLKYIDGNSISFTDGISLSIIIKTIFSENGYDGSRYVILLDTKKQYLLNHSESQLLKFNPEIQILNIYMED